jgi:hypothetical protein
MYNQGMWKDKTLIIHGLLLVIIILLAVIFAPRFAAYVPANALPAQPMGGMNGMGADAPMGMTLKTFDVAPGEPVPTLRYTVESDGADGWNLHLFTTNFTFTPQNINGEPVAGEGHVHLYIDGKLTVVFGPWYHIDALTPGAHAIAVSLNNNDHSVYSYQGKYIEATSTLMVP